MGKYVGIDLGTTYSAVAYIDKDNKPQVIKNAENENTTPSVVLYDDGQMMVGSEAKSTCFSSPETYIANVKRVMGKNERYLLGSQSYAPEEVSSMILKKIKQDAENSLGEEVLGAVITCPAYFTDAQRQATRDAAKIIGLPVLGIINEPTAAALAYGIKKGSNENKKVLIYDMGGGTFDVSIMEFSKDKVETLCSLGDSELGGSDFDQLIMDWFKSKAKELNLDIDADLMAKQSLFIEAERVKKLLSGSRNEVQIALPVQGKLVKAKLTQSEFENMIDNYVYESISVLNSALDEANLEYEDLDQIILVGGSTKIPYVRRMIEEETGIVPSTDINADEAVAIGAAYAAVNFVRDHDQIIENEEIQKNEQKPVYDKKEIPTADQSYTFTDRTSHGIGIEIYDEETGEDMYSVILPKNSILPAEEAKEFQTIIDYQTEIEIIVRQGESPNIKYTTEIGKSILKLRPKPKNSPIQIVISCDLDGLVHVSVFDLTDNENLGEMRIDRAANMNEECIQEAINKLGELNIG